MIFKNVYVVCMYVWYEACHKCAHLWKGVHVYVHMGRRQSLMLGILLYYSPPFIFETGSFIELGRQVPRSCSSPCILLEQGLKMHITMPCFSMGVGDPHLGPHTLTIST